jgi:hypothetical protein
MKKRLAELADRRRMLLERIVIQRIEVAELASELKRPLALADAGLRGVRFMRDHPGLVSGGLVALLSFRGKGIAGQARKWWRLMYLYPSILSLVSRFLPGATHVPNRERDTRDDY